MAHHLFGIPSNIERIRALCRRRGIFVVEDAAQAMGVECNGRNLGTLGDVGIFSLGRGKHITSGSGGIVVTRSDQIAHAIGRQWRSLKPPSAFKVLKELMQLVLMAIFIRPSLYWIPAALPCLRLGETIFPAHVTLERLSGMQAGALRNWPRRLRQSKRARAENAAELSRRLSLIPPCGPSHPYLRLPILAATPGERDRMHSLSQQRGLGLSLAYPTPINEIPQIKWLFDGQHFPGARTVAAQMLTLPTHHWLSDADTQAIAACSEKHVAVARPAEEWQRAS